MATATTLPPISPSRIFADGPILCAGDTMSREEFLRRWDALPDLKRAELIGGMVYMPSPVGFEHGQAEQDMGYWLTHYRIATPGTETASNATTLLLKDAPQPDVHLRILPECGGRTTSVGKLLSGPPELVLEICGTSAAYDLHPKYDLYRNAGVLEYVAVLMEEREIRWHQLVGSEYRRVEPDDAGVWRSQVFPGLWLDGPAVLARDMTRVLATLNEGIASPEHAAFVERLTAAGR